MDAGHQSSDLQANETQSLIQSLKCPVCWDYFIKPHTLACGHTFCLRCLQNLARIVRSSKCRTPLDRLRFRCPSCRKMTLARPILRRKAAVNYALKELIEDWYESPYSCGTFNYITLRSVGSQTEHVLATDIIDHKTGFINIVVNPKLAGDTDERNSSAVDTTISETEYRKILFHRIIDQPNLDKISKPEARVNEISSTLQTTDGNGSVSEESFVTSSSEEEESEQEIQIAPLFGNIRVINDNDDVVINRPRFSRFYVTSVSGVLAILFSEIAVVYRGIRNSRSRTILTLFWFLYGCFIVYISRSFLPWMTFYTVIYFIIIYAEMAPSPLQR